MSHCKITHFLQVTSCQIGLLADGVIASPLKETYGIGELVTFSCPAGKRLTGEATAICNPSLDFSPNPADVRCIQGKFYIKLYNPLALC